MTQKVILCYGDSNTWGYIPNAGNAGSVKSRYSRNERWTGLLQELLGQSFYVIEEGLNSRTTNLNYHIPPDRNGKTYLPACLYSHSPIDLVILALGGNDLKTYFKREPEDIQKGLAELVDIIQQSEYGSKPQHPPQILITTVPIPLQIAESFRDENNVLILEGAIKKAQSMAELFFRLAKQQNCHFLDITKDITPSPIDGVHLDKSAHQKLAIILKNKIKNIFHDKLKE